MFHLKITRSGSTAMGEQLSMLVLIENEWVDTGEFQV